MNIQIKTERNWDSFFVRVKVREHKKNATPSVENVETWKWKKVTSHD